MADPTKTWTRRLFVREALTGWLTFVVAPGLYSLLGLALRQARSSNAERIVVSAEKVFSVGSSRLVQLGDERVLVVRGLDGVFHALGAECTHLGCSLRFEPRDSGRELACNCHDSRFDLDGENLSGPAPTPLNVFGVEVVKGEVVVSRSPS